MPATRREFVKTSAAATTALAAGYIPVYSAGVTVNFDCVGLCAAVPTGTTVARVGLINETYFENLHNIGTHVPELGLPQNSYTATGDQGTPANKATDVARWRNEQTHIDTPYQKWSLNGRRLEIQTTVTALHPSVRRAAKLRLAYTAAGFPASTPVENWYKDSARVRGVLEFRAGRLTDGRERAKNYDHKYHSGRWIFQPYLPGKTPVRQNDLNDAILHSVDQVTAIVLYGLADNQVQATITLNQGPAVHAFVANLPTGQGMQSQAAHIVSHVRAYYALYPLRRDIGHDLLASLPVPVGSVPNVAGRTLTPPATSNGDVYCPGGAP